MTKQDPIKRNNSSLHDLLKSRDSVYSEYIKTLFPANLYDKLKSKLMLKKILAEENNEDKKSEEHSNEEKESLNKLLEESDDEDADEEPSKSKPPSPAG